MHGASAKLFCLRAYFEGLQSQIIPYTFPERCRQLAYAVCLTICRRIGAQMYALDEVIGLRNLDVNCRLCGWAEARTVAWLSTRRDMNCPSCASVIVLNTSEFKRSIAALRRQVAALQQQLTETFTARARSTTFEHRTTRAKSAIPSCEPVLMLADRYKTSAPMARPVAVRRLRSGINN